jgi:hypothetical protein
MNHKPKLRACAVLCIDTSYILAQAPLYPNTLYLAVDKDAKSFYIFRKEYDCNTDKDYFYFVGTYFKFRFLPVSYFSKEIKCPLKVKVR